MISKPTLRELVRQRLKDDEVLMSKRRYTAAVYMNGYALEVALKLKICRIFRFGFGFPETRTEFDNYKRKSTQRDLINAISQIKEIRNHNLNKLLFYSGVELMVKRDYLEEWNDVVNWGPEIRYQLLKVTKKDAVKKIGSVKKLTQSIL
jgi:hypothetical protein